MVVEKLKKLKEKSRLTNQQLADLSGVPVSTIARILAGDTPNPQFQTIADLVIAMGGSLDEFCGIEPRTVAAQEVPAPTHELIALYQEMLQDKKELIKERNKVVKALAFALSIFVGVVLLLLVIDITNGNFGYFRY